MSDESIFINRELSWLDFNRRVLALGKDKNVPLGERIKFLAIYGSNLDEFFMVRVGSLQERANLEQSKTKKEKRENKTNMTAAEQLAAIMPKTAQLQEECDKFYAKALENLAENAYHKVDFDHLTKEEEHLWKKYFQSELFPILSPQIVDNRHPFPFLRNKEIYLGVLLKEKHTQEQSLGIVPISSQMERLHFIKKDGAVQFALTEELVLHYASSIFGKDSIQEKCLFRVTRNADIDVKEGMMDHDIDYREIMTELLRRRRKLAAVRLQITPAPAPEVERLLRQERWEDTRRQIQEAYAKGARRRQAQLEESLRRRTDAKLTALANIQEALEAYRDRLAVARDLTEESLEARRAEVQQLLDRLRDREASIRARTARRYRQSLRILRGNPSASAKAFAEALESLRKLGDRREGEDGE